jgi:hypothetical protein
VGNPEKNYLARRSRNKPTQPREPETNHSARIYRGKPSTKEIQRQTIQQGDIQRQTIHARDPETNHTTGRSRNKTFQPVYTSRDKQARRSTSSLEVQRQIIQSGNPETNQPGDPLINHPEIQRPILRPGDPETNYPARRSRDKLSSQEIQRYGKKSRYRDKPVRRCRDKSSSLETQRPRDTRRATQRQISQEIQRQIIHPIE